MTTEYQEFLSGKAVLDPSTGFEPVADVHPSMFPHQRDITRWALRRGRAAIFAGCGLGKTLMQLEWARQVAEHTSGKVLVLTPLAVAQQTIREGERFGIGAAFARSHSEVRGPITVTNYDRLDHFQIDQFNGVVLDESSILKSFEGAIRTSLIEACASIAFRLACTATPAPNDYMELGNHSEFLGVMSRTEMLATFFVHDGGETQKWRLKGHATRDFWTWLCSWAVMLRQPSDLGYSDEGFKLPALSVVQHTVASPIPEGALGVVVQASTLLERRDARRVSIRERASTAAALVNATPGPWLVWCGLNAEADALLAMIPDAVGVEGADDRAVKESRLLGFARGEFRVLVTKPSIAGFGMNWQHCHQLAFVGLSDSWEQYYQAVRRCWRFGQLSDVSVHVITAEAEGAVVGNIQRKDAAAEAMAVNMVNHMKDLSKAAVHGGTRTGDDYLRDKAHGIRWTLHLGDCVEVLSEIPSESVDYSIFSPPFAALYTYSASDRDMGNVGDQAEFAKHFDFAVRELRRVIRPGRLVSFHCMNLPTVKVRDGVIGIRDFRGDLIRQFEAHGFIFHSEVCIWKDPVTAMQRTKALGLLHKTIRNDSSMSRQGIPDYLVTMRAPGDNRAPISHTREEYPVSLWQRIASPVWMDINPNDTLQFRSARENEDERHICPLQLEVIRRALTLWSNPDDLVLSPFAGIGSEGVIALETGRRFIGVELKGSYFRQAAGNLAQAEGSAGQSLMASGE